jgi:hypothetical protein
MNKNPIQYVSILLPVVVFALFSASAPAARAPATLNGSVGLSTIKLKTASGQPVRILRPAVYRLVVTDRSRRRNFHLMGPTGILNRKTTLNFVGTQIWRVKLTTGAYAFFSDTVRSPRGSFSVK